MPDDKMHPLEKIAWAAVLGLLFWLAFQNPFALMGDWAVRPLVADCAPEHDPSLTNVHGEILGWNLHTYNTGTARGPLPTFRSRHAIIDQAGHREHATLCDTYLRDQKCGHLDPNRFRPTSIAHQPQHGDS